MKSTEGFSQYADIESGYTGEKTTPNMTHDHNIPSILEKHFYEPDEGSFMWFAKNTTFHGFNNVANAQTKVKRIAWIIAILIAFAVLVAIVSHRYEVVMFHVLNK